MRILIANNFSYVTGGVDRHCFDLASLLQDDGHEVAFLSTDAPHRLAQRGAFIPLLVTNDTRGELSPSASARVATRATWNRTAHAATRRLIQDFQPDVIHSHKLYPHLSRAPIAAAQELGVPIVQTAHDYEFVSANAFDHTGAAIDHNETHLRYRALNTALFELKTRFHVPAVTSWVTVSDAIAKIYATHGIESRSIPNFTLSQTGPAPAFEDRTGAVFAGRLTHDKGIEDLIALATAIPELQVRVAGFGPLADRVATAARRLSNLTYVGVLSQEGVQQELRRARVCLMPSRWEEPGPLVCLEAMAAGTPIVAYDHGGLAEYVTAAHAGRVVASDPIALAAGAATLAADANEWTRASSNAMAALREQHSPDDYLDAILEVYANATGDQAQRKQRSLRLVPRAA
ncbi:MAG: glycosyltransferase family 4 protein [Solirubrobacteraceae bacterium]|nr:glycosyltransferase family 4 protein [Solirubrobacteraceae bacterium]